MGKMDVPKNVPRPPGRPAFPAFRGDVLLAGALLVLAVLMAYRHSGIGPFIFDDEAAIVENPTIRQLWPPWSALSPPHGDGVTVGGRPLVNFSLAVNYAAGGTAVRGYHALNLAIHVLAALTLFGVMRRTLLLGSTGQALRLGSGYALLLALTVALLWALHPLQTESVTYIIQRAESLMGLCYLLTLYCFIRGTESSAPSVWYALSITACLAGMAAKEVMVSAPLLVLLYDRTFVAGTCREAWRRRREFYLGLAGTWLLLGWLVAGTGGRGGTAGLGAGVSGWAYSLTQFRSVERYLWLSLWPHPLVFEYGISWVRRMGEIVPGALIVLVLVAGTVAALRLRAAAGFAGVWFFAILAPTSLVTTMQPTVEHRMYLPLAAVLALVVPGLYFLCGRRSLLAGLALAAGLGAMTARRNQDYRSELALWGDTVAKRPGNPLAHCFLGDTLAGAGRVPEALAQYAAAVRLRPEYAEARNNWGNALVRAGRIPEALAQYAEAVRLKPDYPKARNNFANTLLRTGRVPEAVAQYEEALRLQPGYAEAHYNLGNALVRSGRLDDGLTQYAEALQLQPDDAETHYNFGNALFQAGRLPDAKAHYERTLALKPDAADACNNLGSLLFQMGRRREAEARFEQALRLRPDDVTARNNLARLRNLPASPESEN